LLFSIIKKQSGDIVSLYTQIVSFLNLLPREQFNNYFRPITKTLIIHTYPIQLKVKLPKELIKEITDEQDCGMVCYVHKETLKLESYPNEATDNYELLESWGDVIDKVNDNYKDYIKVESMGSSEQFELMKVFTNDIVDEKLKRKLLEILDKKKPFKNWKNIVESELDYRESWFTFKQQKLKEHVKMKFSQ